MIEPVPDPVVRAAIRVDCARGCGRERRRGAGASSARSCEQLRALGDRRAGREAERAALRGAGRLLPARARATPQVHVVPLARRASSTLARGRGGDARADLRAGAASRTGWTILDLGCGWGSLTFWLAERYPSSRILAVSNSRTQRAVHRRARARVRNVEVGHGGRERASTPTRRFDRVVSVEMFEHMRNYEALLGRIAAWLEPGGTLLRARLLARARSPTRTTDDVDGAPLLHRRHHAVARPAAGVPARPRARGPLGGRRRRTTQRTAEAWLERLDAQRRPTVLATVRRRAAAAGASWRVFFMACAELWGYRGRQRVAGVALPVPQAITAARRPPEPAALIATSDLETDSASFPRGPHLSLWMEGAGIPGGRLTGSALPREPSPGESWVREHVSVSLPSPPLMQRALPTVAGLSAVDPNSRDDPKPVLLRA